MMRDFWDAKSGKELLVLEGHENTVFFAGFGPDDRLLITFGPRKVEAESVAYAWDVSRLMAGRTGAGATTICGRQVWERSTQNGVVALSIDEQALNAAIPPGRRSFAMLGNGGRVKVFDLSGAKPILRTEFRSHSDIELPCGGQIAFRTDDVLAVAGEDSEPTDRLSEGGNGVTPTNGTRGSVSPSNSGTFPTIACTCCGS